MFDAVNSLLAFIVAISILVAVHEYGHYIVGRWSGMKVLRFSIGFGKPIWTRVGAGEDRTEYCISAIPLGGYVRFLDAREGPVAPRDVGRAFNQRPIPARILVLLAGPLFNFLFAILAYWALFVYGVPTMRPAIGDVEPGSVAAQAGLEQGDRIIAVGDVETEDWESALVAMLDGIVSDGRVSLRLLDTDGGQRSAEINVAGEAGRLTEPGMLFEGLGFDPWQPPAVVGEVTPDGAAKLAGIEKGDRIVSVDGVSIRNFAELRDLVAARPGKDVSIEIDRGTERQRLDVIIGSVEQDGSTIGQLGVGAEQNTRDYFYLRKYGAIESIGRATERMWQSAVFTLRMLGRMVTGDVSIKNISGPINIAQFAGASAQAGISNFLGFLAIVSISLGVLNLLPLPVLDGGQIVYQLVELFKGSPMSERAQILGQQVGIFALLLLMSFAFYNDIARILS
ncbi:MAG TPA: RIP metalloprotease RseP [Woeseiaceae bacterium]|nr:RIP metalloprotease RseP [Woeseiaceae bacterium]